MDTRQEAIKKCIIELQGLNNFSVAIRLEAYLVFLLKKNLPRLRTVSLNTTHFNNLPQAKIETFIRAVGFLKPDNLELKDCNLLGLPTQDQSWKNFCKFVKASEATKIDMSGVKDLTQAHINQMKKITKRHAKAKGKPATLKYFAARFFQRKIKSDSDFLNKIKSQLPQECLQLIEDRQTGYRVIAKAGK